MSGGSTFESVTTFGIFCKSIPFKIAEKAKEPAKTSWYDEHGDDEYIPSTGLFLEAYSMEVEFGCKLITSERDVAKFGVTVSDVRTTVGNFLKWLRESGMIFLMSTYTRIGRQNVRFEGVSDDAKWKNENGEEWLIFKVTFKVNDPKTDVYLDE